VNTIVKNFDLDSDKQMSLDEYLDCFTFKHLQENVRGLADKKTGRSYVPE